MSMHLPSYMTGLTDGEGCFSVSFSLRKKMRYGIEVRPSFSISQHERNRSLIKAVQQYFRCGSIRYSAHDRNVKFEVRSIHDLIRSVIPHFQSFPLQSSKQKDFIAFQTICEIIHSNHHRSSAGLVNIINLAASMNEAGKRKYDQQTLLSMIRKMKV